MNCCTIDWYDEWPSEALQAVAKAHLDVGDIGAEDFHDAISNACVLIHRSVDVASASYLRELRRHYFVTPKSYIEFIQLYRSLLHKKKAEYDFNLKRISLGLKKVAEAKDMVTVMQEELIKLGPVLEERSKVFL